MELERYLTPLALAVLIMDSASPDNRICKYKRFEPKETYYSKRGRGKINKSSSKNKGFIKL